jgi:hypothetical protein
MLHGGVKYTKVNQLNPVRLSEKIRTFNDLLQHILKAWISNTRPPAALAPYGSAQHGGAIF